MARLYEILGQTPFAHDFDQVEYDEPEFDGRLNMPGLHRVFTRVHLTERKTILPPDLFNQFDNAFWSAPGQNPRNVILL